MPYRTPTENDEDRRHAAEAAEFVGSLRKPSRWLLPAAIVAIVLVVGAAVTVLAFVVYAGRALPGDGPRPGCVITTSSDGGMTLSPECSK